MPRQKLSRRRKHGELSENEFWELLIGPGQASCFKSEAERKRVWLEHEAELRGLVNPGTVPWAAEHYDTPPAP